MVDKVAPVVYYVDMTTTKQPYELPYWCDYCHESFTGSAALIHKGSRCHAKDQHVVQQDALEQVQHWSEQATISTENRDNSIRVALNDGHSLRAIAAAASLSVEGVRKIATR